MGNTHADLLDFVKAKDALAEAIMITRNIGWEGGLSVTLNAMGHLKKQLEELREAEELFQESISVAKHIGDRFSLARGLEGLGDCFRLQSKPGEAAPLLEEACLLWHELSQLRRSNGVASTLVDLKSSQGDWDRALFWHDHIIAVCRIQQDWAGVANHLIDKGTILEKTQRYDEAALHFEVAVVTCRENALFWSEERVRFCAIPKTVMRWERRLPLLCNVKKLQRRLPHLFTASLKMPITADHAEP